MRRKSKPTILTPEEITFWKEKNNNLIKELVEYKNSRKQLQQDMDYMIKEKFITDQKLHRLEEICLIVNNKTKSCLDKIVACSTDLAEIFGLLNTVNKIKQSMHTETANSTLIDFVNESPDHNLQNWENQNGLNNAQEDKILEESSFISRGRKTVHSKNNHGNVSLTHTDEEISNFNTQTWEKHSNSKKAQEEDTSLHESSFVSRGGKTVIEQSNLELTDAEMDVETGVADDTEYQNNQTPAGKVLSIIHEDWENSSCSSENAGPAMTLQDATSLTYRDQLTSRPKNVNLRRKDSYPDDEDISTNVEPSSTLENTRLNYSYEQLKNITVTPKRSSNNDSTLKPQGKLSLKRKSIDSPRPSMKGRTSIIMRKSSEGKQRSLSERINSPGSSTIREGRKSSRGKPLSERINSPASLTINGRDTLPYFPERTLNAAQDLSYMTEFIKNTSTPIQSKATSGSRNKHKTSQTICDEKPERTTEFNSNSGNTTLEVQNNDTSSLQENNPDLGDSLFKYSKRRRCLTINPLQRYLEQSNKSESAAKSTKFDISAEDESSEDEQIDTISSRKKDLPTLNSTEKRKYPSGRKTKKVSRRIHTECDSDEQNESENNELLADNRIETSTSSQKDNPVHNITASRSSRRKKYQTVDLVQQYLESSQRCAETRPKRATKKVEYKEPSVARKMRRS